MMKMRVFIIVNKQNNPLYKLGDDKDSGILEIYKDMESAINRKKLLDKVSNNGEREIKECYLSYDFGKFFN